MAQRGLSVCIPAYNYAALPLVQDLLVCEVPAGWTIEIRVYEDGPQSPTAAENSEALNSLAVEAPFVLVYTCLPQNLGRSQIRNQLAADARHPYLLYIDVDSRLPDRQFLANYLAVCEQEPVVVGGTIYRYELPPLPQRLRWLYGLRREMRPLVDRRLTPYASLALNNVLVTKQVLRRLPIPQLPGGYGHEDTLWGELLKREKIGILHIQNPVEHVGLETAADFIAKTEAASQNLYYLLQQGQGTDTRLAKAYTRARAMGMRPLHGALAAVARRLIAFPLTAVRGLDLLKLATLLAEDTRNGK